MPLSRARLIEITKKLGMHADNCAVMRISGKEASDRDYNWRWFAGDEKTCNCPLREVWVLRTH